MTSVQPNADSIRDLFDRIAPVYDDLNQSLSLGLHRVWKQMAVRWSGAQPGMTCLDLCCGSGDLALLLARQVGPQGQVTGADFAVAQLAIARQRAAQQRLRQIDWIEADALALPFETAQFEAATMGYGLRNLTDIPQGLTELCRVLKPGATAAVLDFHQPQQVWIQQFQQWYLQAVVVPAAERCGLTEEYAYIGPSVERFPNGSEQVALAQQVGFANAVHYPLLGGMMGVLVATK
ncbi:MAG: bifunctional demethylmenaquinone methyltransferase/2-methoxy-6-polyprenyl-1,4-benzoquinol methylase UbiE [Leptolyngbya sp. SIO4C1]|nr:bifunctional demethylmenaquinone methyltransferase/2-methoxy-6-polyprenyl-1,4-benzoquinol methylase UbiE [Leptolyngbya sp. SIO4C1]